MESTPPYRVTAICEAPGEASLSMDGYQRLALETAVYPEEHRITYPALGLPTSRPPRRQNHVLAAATCRHGFTGAYVARRKPKTPRKRNNTSSTHLRHQYPR